jgi:L-ascorbate metabolism protein UlaG (beta-lactamase superfamily)
MQITWHGQYTIKIVSKALTLVLDPYAPNLGLSAFRAKADIVALSNPQTSSMSHVAGIQGEPFIMNTPGEYSLKAAALYALGWHASDNTERSLQRWKIEGMTLLHLGALERALSDEELAKLERTDIDILLVAVGGGSGLDTRQALQLVTTVEPRVVIPIHYQLPRLREKLTSVAQFAKEMGISQPKQAESKFTIRANKLPQQDVQTVILTP